MLNVLDMSKQPQGGSERRFAIVVSRFNEPVSKRLLEGALAAFGEAGISEEKLLVAWVPGAFEIPSAAAKLARSGDFDALLCLGAVIRGETPHFDYICEETARGLGEISREYSLPCLFGVLTCDTLEQAMERSGGKHGNKGAEVARGAMEMAALFAQFEKMGKIARENRS